MLSKLYSKILFVFITLFTCVSVSAQDGAYSGFTPYSIFGIGDVSKQGTSFNKGMGGVGIATRNNRFLNLTNPAAVTARDSLAFMGDFGLAGSSTMLKQEGINSGSNTFNIYDFAFSFPIYKSSAMYVGITPFSNIGYGFYTSVDDPNILGQVGDVTYASTGNGSLYDAFIGGGITFWKRLSIGAQASYYFGSINKYTALTFSESSYRSLTSGYDLTLRAVSGKVGIQYEIPLKQGSSLTIGATYRAKSDMKGYVDDYKYASISGVSDTLKFSTDTLKNLTDRVNIASEIGVGISYKLRDKLLVEFDYTRSDWSKSNMNNTTGFANVSQNTRFATTTAQSFRGGFEITPNRNDVRYYLKRVTYRAGAYYDQAYYTLNDNPVNTVGITFGATLPINRWYNGITFAIDLGQRGYARDYMVRERFVNFTVSFNIFDIWFQKTRYN